MVTVLHGRIRTGYRPFLGVHPINPLDHRKKSLYGAIRDSASFRGGEFFTDWLEVRKVRNSANLILQKRNKKEKTRHVRRVFQFTSEFLDVINNACLMLTIISIRPFHLEINGKGFTVLHVTIFIPPNQLMSRGRNKGNLLRRSKIR